METEESSSKKQILKSSAIIGGASVITILVGLVKTKTLAVLLGPAGIGMMGLLISIFGTASTIFGMGLGTSAVKDIAKNIDNLDIVFCVRKALIMANLSLGLLAILLAFIFRESLSYLLFDSYEYQTTIIILAMGVFFTLISNSQAVLLQGYRKIGELAKVKILGAITSTIIGIIVIYKYGVDGIVVFVIALPFSLMFINYYYNRFLPSPHDVKIRIRQLPPYWRSMFSLGLVFMFTALLGRVGDYYIRDMINQQFGMQSVGYFQAAWSISMMYITFVLGAMAADYYPRLAQSIHDKTVVNGMVNEQMQIAIVFAAPVLLCMLTFAPIVIHLLYSQDFEPTINILRWQIIGDILKVLSWPIGFIFIAQGRVKLVFISETAWYVVYILTLYFGLEYFKLDITGYAFLISYVSYLAIVYFFSFKTNGFIISSVNVKIISLLMFSSLLILGVSYFDERISMALGGMITLISLHVMIKELKSIGIKNRARS